MILRRPVLTPRRSLLALATLVLALSMATCVLLLRGVLVLPVDQVLQFFGVIGIVLLAHLWLMPMQRFGPAFIVMLYTILSHLGFPILLFFDPNNHLYDTMMTSRHLYREHIVEVFAGSSLAIGAFMIGWRIVGGVCYERESPALGELTGRLRATPFGRAYVLFTSLVCYGFSIVLSVFVASNGLVGSNYSEVRSAFGSAAVVAYFSRLFWVALVTLSSFGTRRDLARVAPAVVLIGLAYMASGNRNDILYPLAAAFGMYVLVHRRVPKIPLLGGVVILFVVNPWIAGWRQEGGFTGDAELRTADALYELALQVRPFTIVLHLADSGMEPMFGSSLIVPTLAVATLGLAWQTADVRESQYFIENILVQQGHGGLGFSMIAEMWLNFGWVGATCVYFGLGCGLAFAERRVSTTTGLLGYSTLSLLLVFWARNSLQFNVVLFMFLFAIVFVAYLAQGSSQRPNARMAAHDHQLGPRRSAHVLRGSQ